MSGARWLLLANYSFLKGTALNVTMLSSSCMCCVHPTQQMCIALDDGPLGQPSLAQPCFASHPSCNRSLSTAVRPRSAAVTPAGAAQCNVCLPGSYAASGKSSVCSECPRGTYQNKYGQQQCNPCKEGTYQDARAAAKCKVCPAGTFNPEKGSVSAQACQ